MFEVFKKIRNPYSTTILVEYKGKTREYKNILSLIQEKIPVQRLHSGEIVKHNRKNAIKFKLS